MFEGMNSFQIAYWACALFGTSFYTIKVFMVLLGGLEHGMDDAHEVSHDGADSPDSAFKVISITSLTGFFMMFGWVGLATYEQAGVGAMASLLAAFIAGVSTMYITAWIFKIAGKLHSSGAVFDINHTVGQRASVYQKITADGRGQIQVSVAGVTHEINALSEDGSEIESFKTVEVVRVVDAGTVSVKTV